MDILASFLKINRYIKHEKSHYLLAKIYNSVIKLPYYFVKTVFDIFNSQIFNVIYKSMKNCLWYFYSSNISSSHLSVLEAFQVPPFQCKKFSGSPSNHPPTPPLVIYERSLMLVKTAQQPNTSLKIVLKRKCYVVLASVTPYNLKAGSSKELAREIFC